MIKKPDEKLPHAFMAIPGFEPDDDGNGHKQDSAAGKVWIRNLRPNDMIFESKMFGSINISYIYRRIQAKNWKTFELPVASILHNISRRYIDKKYASALPTERLEVPVLVSFSDTGLEVIDGVHRIHRLAALAATNAKAYFVPPSLIREARIRKFRIDQTGVWVDDDTMNSDDFEKAMKGAENFIKTIPMAVLAKLSGM